MPTESIVQSHKLNKTIKCILNKNNQNKLINWSQSPLYELIII